MRRPAPSDPPTVAPRRRRLPRLRPTRRRSAVIWWLGVVALAAATWVVVDGALRSAARARARWGDTTTVVVATREVRPGETLAGAVEERRWPVAVVPEGTLERRPSPGTVAASRIGAGEAVVGQRVAGHGEGPDALIPPGWRAVVVPLALPGLPAEPGDRVDLAATDRADVLVRDGVVVDVAGDRAVVAVPPDDAADLAAALGAGPVVVLVHGPGG